MRVVLLSPYFLKHLPTAQKIFNGADLVLHEGPPAEMPDGDFIVSFGYNYIIGQNILSQYQRKAINVHIGYLPFNRGADPNFWSWFDNTKKGVTIHLMDQSVDTGDIIFQVEVSKFRNPDMTLKTTYDELMQTGVNMLRWSWPGIREGRMSTRHQPRMSGTLHKLIDKEPLMKELPLVWDTPVAAVEELGKRKRGEA